MSRDDDSMPPLVLASLMRYIEHRTPVGGFLEAVLSNDLKLAVNSADVDNQYKLCTIVRWCYYNLPSMAWGSSEKYYAWITQKEDDSGESDTDAEAGELPSAGSDGG
jgi:hypothetical protein